VPIAALIGYFCHQLQADSRLAVANCGAARTGNIQALGPTIKAELPGALMALSLLALSVT
jgi:hypothetical protein